MSRVKLGDVAFERKETCKDSHEQYRIIGLEHLIPDQIILTEWSDDPETTFTKYFHKGDILFGRRRAYLRKAAVAPFDGICSGDITVISAIDGMIDNALLPHIIQNETFFDYAVGESAGSLSPRVKWEKLAQYEFELPSLDKQKSLAEVLWSMVETQEAYKDLIQKTDNLVKSVFIEMFGDPEKNPIGWDFTPLGDIAFVTKLAGFEYTKYIDYKDSGDIIMIRGLNCKGTKLILDDIKWIDKDTSDLLPRSKLFKGDIVITYVGTVGEIGLIDKDDTYHLAPNVAKISLNNKVLENPEFWAYMLMISREYVIRFATSTTQAALNMDKIRKIGFINPPIELQNKFVELLHQSDKSKFALQQTLDALNKTYKKIISDYLG